MKRHIIGKERNFNKIKDLKSGRVKFDYVNNLKKIRRILKARSFKKKANINYENENM